MTTKTIDLHPHERQALDQGELEMLVRVIDYDREFFGADVTIEHIAHGHSGPGWYVYSNDYPDEGTALVACPYPPGTVLRCVVSSPYIAGVVSSCHYQPIGTVSHVEAKRVRGMIGASGECEARYTAIVPCAQAWDATHPDGQRWLDNPWCWAIRITE